MYTFVPNNSFGQLLVKKLKTYTKINKSIIKSDDTEIMEYEFYQCKSPISINVIDINKIVVSKKFPFGKEDIKYFIGYKDSEEIRPFLIFCPQINVYKFFFIKLIVCIFV